VSDALQPVIPEPEAIEVEVLIRRSDSSVTNIVGTARVTTKHVTTEASGKVVYAIDYDNLADMLHSLAEELRRRAS
jgi:hypothetical protein